MTTLPANFCMDTANLAPEWRDLRRDLFSLYVPGLILSQKEFVFDTVRRSLDAVSNPSAGGGLNTTPAGAAVRFNSPSRDGNGIVIPGGREAIAGATDMTLFWVGRWFDFSGTTPDVILDNWRNLVQEPAQHLSRVDPSDSEIQVFFFTVNGSESVSFTPTESWRDNWKINTLAVRYASGSVDIWSNGERSSQSVTGTSLGSDLSTYNLNWHVSERGPSFGGRFDMLLGALVFDTFIADETIARWAADPFGIIRRRPGPPRAYQVTAPPAFKPWFSAGQGVAA